MFLLKETSCINRYLNQRKLNYIVYIFTAVVHVGCCTKRDCNPARANFLILFENFQHEDLEPVLVYQLNKGSNTLADSMKYFLSGGELLVDMTRPGNFNFNDYTYVFKTKVPTYDTLSNVNYQIDFENIKCNRCFPVRFNKEFYPVLSTIEFEHNGIKSIGNTTVVFNKP